MPNSADESSFCFRCSIKVVALCAVAFASVVRAETVVSTETPAIEGYGKIHVFNDKKSPYAASPKAISKFVFAVSKAAKDPKSVDPELEKIARAINLMVADGVPTDHLDIVVLVGGEAAEIAMNNPHYRAAFGTENPNSDLLSKLHKVGVSIVVSDQALAAKSLDSNSLVDFASMTLSSFTAMNSLVQAGYTLAAL